MFIKNVPLCFKQLADHAVLFFAPGFTSRGSFSTQCTTLKKDARAKVPLACIWAKRWIKDGKLKERVNNAATSVLRQMLPDHHPPATLLSSTFGTFLLHMVSPTNRGFDLEICLFVSADTLHLDDAVCMLQCSSHAAGYTRCIRGDGVGCTFTL